MVFFVSCHYLPILNKAVSVKEQEVKRTEVILKLLASRSGIRAASDRVKRETEML
jgi:hypothetical protein